MRKPWFIIEDEQDIAALCDVWGGGLDGSSALVLGDSQLADKAAHAFASVRWIDANGSPAESFADAAGDYLAALAPDIVLGVARTATRIIAGNLAATAGAAIASNVVRAQPAGENVEITRAVYDDFLEEGSTAAACVCLLVNPLAVRGDAFAGGGESAEIERVDIQAIAHVEVTGVESAPASQVESAARVVGMGFGARSPEAFSAAKDLADALGAEVGASMNMVENTTLMPGERYIGLSGMDIAPKLYVALGIAGAAQHLAGIRNAGTVVVVNSDPKAKFFNHSDYGIVGRIEDVAPAIVRALQSA